MKLLREYIKSLILENKSEPDLTRYVDDLEDEIFSFLFTKSTFDYLQSLPEGEEATTVLETEILE